MTWLLSGFALGVVFTTVVFWMPSRAHWRRRVDDLLEVRRIQGGYALAGRDELGESTVAMDQAQFAYLPVYPGRRDPDPAWLTWIEEGGLTYRTEGRRHHSHRSTEPAPAPAPEPLPLDRSGNPGPQWGAVCWCPRCLGRLPHAADPWELGWGPVGLLAPLALLAAVWPSYPIRQRLLDRGWEYGVIFEVSGARFNRATIRVAERLWVATAERLTGLIGRAQSRPPHRVKRHYPVRRAPWAGSYSGSTASLVTTPTAAMPDMTPWPAASGRPSGRPPVLIGRPGH